MNSKTETTDRKPRVEKPAEGPPVQEYPKMLYHPDGRTLTVANAEAADSAAKMGFLDTPQPPPSAEPKPKG